MATAVSVSTSIPAATGVGRRRAIAVVGAALASLGPIAIVETTTETRIVLALMHVIVAIVLILGLRATIPAHRSADGGQGQS